MQCSDWEHAQDADPVIKHTKELMRELGKVAPNDVQLGSEAQEVKNLCKTCAKGSDRS